MNTSPNVVWYSYFFEIPDFDGYLIKAKKKKSPKIVKLLERRFHTVTSDQSINNDNHLSSNIPYWLKVLDRFST